MVHLFFSVCSSISHQLLTVNMMNLRRVITGVNEALGEDGDISFRKEQEEQDVSTRCIFQVPSSKFSFCGLSTILLMVGKQLTSRCSGEPSDISLILLPITLGILKKLVRECWNFICKNHWSPKMFGHTYLLQTLVLTTVQVGTWL